MWQQLIIVVHVPLALLLGPDLMQRGLVLTMSLGRYVRLLLIGYFEGLDAERAIAWRAADSFALREFIGLVWPRKRPKEKT